jgi:3-dehydroquinate dehydratase-2
MNLLIINGPNMNLLGIREVNVYGTKNYDSLVNEIKEFANENRITVELKQSNSEGEIIDIMHNAISKFDGMVINPGAYTHYSYAIHDAIKAVQIPTIEVHISNIGAREDFRHSSVILPACIGQISGLGFQGYILAMQYFIRTGK